MKFCRLAGEDGMSWVLNFGALWLLKLRWAGWCGWDRLLGEVMLSWML